MRHFLYFIPWCLFPRQFYLKGSTFFIDSCPVPERLVCHFNKNILLFGKNPPLIHIFKKFLYFSAILVLSYQDSAAFSIYFPLDFSEIAVYIAIWQHCAGVGWGGAARPVYCRYSLPSIPLAPPSRQQSYALQEITIAKNKHFALMSIFTKCSREPPQT
jgi:hypothetical protein